MLFRERLEIVNEYEKWLYNFNERNKEEGLDWGVEDCSLSFLSWLDVNGYLIKKGDKQ